MKFLIKQTNESLLSENSLQLSPLWTHLKYSLSKTFTESDSPSIYPLVFPMRPVRPIQAHWSAEIKDQLIRSRRSKIKLPYFALPSKMVDFFDDSLTERIEIRSSLDNQRKIIDHIFIIWLTFSYSPWGIILLNARSRTGSSLERGKVFSM